MHLGYVKQACETLGEAFLMRVTMKAEKKSAACLADLDKNWAFCGNGFERGNT